MHKYQKVVSCGLMKQTKVRATANIFDFTPDLLGWEFSPYQSDFPKAQVKVPAMIVNKIISYPKIPSV